MKRITLILDGSADRPNAALMNKTPLAAANTPNLDALAQKATKLLRVKTIPDGLEVGSAVANMGLLGLDPHMYRGRAALEAAGSGIPLDPNNLCNPYRQQLRYGGAERLQRRRTANR